MKESGSAARFAREVLSNFDADDLLRKIQPPASIEKKIVALEQRIDDANLILRAIVALQTASLGLLIWLIL